MEYVNPYKVSLVTKNEFLCKVFTSPCFFVLLQNIIHAPEKEYNKNIKCTSILNKKSLNKKLNLKFVFKFFPKMEKGIILNKKKHFKPKVRGGGGDCKSRKMINKLRKNSARTRKIKFS